MHLTFQEYFAALYIVQHRSEATLVKAHAGDPRWREVLLMVGTLLPQPLEFIESLARAVIRSPQYVSARPFMGRLFQIAATPLGLKEAKNIIEADMALLPHDICGERKIGQIKVVRELGSGVLIPSVLLPSGYVEQFKARFAQTVRPWTSDEIDHLKQLGPNAGDVLWIGIVGHLVSGITLFGEACRLSGLAKTLIQAEAVRFMDSFVPSDLRGE